MRKLQPEILDHLPPEDPDAIASRRDLRLINSVMGNQRWLSERLSRHLLPGMRIAELGAGDGCFARRLKDHLPRDFPFEFNAIDLAPCPPDWPDDPRFHWRQEDIFQSGSVREADGVVACLVLHHFDDIALARLGRLFTKARFLLAREPARCRAWMRFLLYPFRLNHVTKHDMKVSIEAGFLGTELANALGLDKAGWVTRQKETALNAFQFEATKCPPAE